MDSTIGRRQRSGFRGRPRWLAVLGIAVLGLALAGCSDSDDTGTTSSGSTTSSSVQGPPPGVQLEGAVNIHGTEMARNDLEMEADDFYFGPTFVEATSNLKFRIALHNEGNAPHTFTSDVLAVDQTLQPDERKTVEVTAPASGFSGFYCKFHRGQGMQGAVFVA